MLDPGAFDDLVRNDVLVVAGASDGDSAGTFLGALAVTAVVVRPLVLPDRTT